MHSKTNKKVKGNIDEKQKTESETEKERKKNKKRKVKKDRTLTDMRK